jgi:hypothetical protein
LKSTKKSVPEYVEQGGFATTIVSPDERDAILICEINGLRTLEGTNVLNDQFGKSKSSCGIDFIIITRGNYSIKITRITIS